MKNIRKKLSLLSFLLISFFLIGTVSVPAPAIAGAPATNQASVLKNGAHIPFTWKLPSYGGKLLVLQGTARVDRVSPSMEIIEQGKLTVTGHGYIITETFLRTGSGGTGKLTEIFSTYGGKKFITDSSFTWQRSSSGGHIQSILTTPGESAGTSQEVTKYTLVNGVMGIIERTQGSGSTTGKGVSAKVSVKAKMSVYIQPSSHNGAEMAALCDTSARKSCKSQFGYSGPALSNAVMTEQTLGIMGLMTFRAFTTPSHN
jgi:hypothetical protein